MFSDFWCKGTIKKATDKMHYTYNENYFPQKSVPLHQNSKVKLKRS